MKRDEGALAGSAAGSMEATIDVPRSLFYRLLDCALERRPSNLGALAEFRRNVPTNRILPLIGSERHGGIYAGATVQEEQHCELILLAGELEDAGWDKAVAWAKEQGGELPSRFDQLVLFKNLKSEFKDAAYWSAEQHAGDSDYAWTQYFSTGGQNYWLKHTNDLRARAVRRVPIQ